VVMYGMGVHSELRQNVKTLTGAKKNR
jgi:hypothetical protein